MNRNARLWMPAIASLSLLLPLTGCAKLEARDQLNKGVQAYKAAKFEEAIDHFQRAVNLDPGYKNTYLYLATAYAQQVVPTSDAVPDTPANQKMAKMAVNAYDDVLKKDPHNPTALKGIASIYFNTGRYDEAKQAQQKVIDVDPKDAEAYYTIGVIDWGQAHKNTTKLLSSLGTTDKGDGNPGIPKKDCQQLSDQNTPLIQSGLDSLHKAVDIRPLYEDAMAYINLMYRQKANVECGDEATRKADIAQAQDWTDKAMAARKENQIKANQATPAGVKMTSGK